jgi:valyl-tRNA synthetase
MKKFESNITFLSQQFNHIRESALDPNEREVRQKLEDHFNIIKSGIDQAHQTTRNTLAKLVAEEERQHKAIRDTAESSLNEIDAKERRIQFMMSLSDAELVEQYSEIERLVQESRRPITNYMKPERVIDLNINPNLDTFTQLIKDSYRVSYNPQTRQEWSCENCGRSNRIGVHQCETCRLPFSGGPQIPRTN